MVKTSIVWFKKDLRLQDNEALFRAIKESEEVIPVYCFDNEQFVMSHFGFRKTGSFRANFLLESLNDLDRALRKLGSGLMIIKGKPEIELPKLILKFAVEKIYTALEVGHEEKETIKLLELEANKLQCKLETYVTHTLIHPDDLPFSITNIPDIFTNFRKAVEKDLRIRPLAEIHQNINSPAIPILELPTLMDLDLVYTSMDDRAAIRFKGGYTNAQARLESYFFQHKSILVYKEKRNGLIGEDYSSKFSAWLALGCISAREIYTQLKQFEKEFGANESTYWLVFELLWRDYFWFMMHKYTNSYFLLNGIHSKSTAPRNHDRNDIDKWKNGETGSNFIDANMTELKMTGFMSNRGRQNVASYFCNDLKLDWRYGAAYFEEQLIDYDVSSNWCNWAYLAGVGNDPRGNRYFDIQKQADLYDADESYRKLWLQKNTS